METNDALEMVFTRNTFYRRQYFWVLGMFALTLIVNAALIWIVTILITSPTKPVFFAMDNIGELINVVPITQPNVTEAELFAWATDAVQSIYTLDYINYRAEMQQSQKYFTTYGWTQYTRALKSSNNLVGITERKQIQLANVVGQPKVLAEGLLGTAYAWKLEMPLLVTYLLPPTYADKNKYTNPLIVTVVIQRQSILQSYKGLGIVQIVSNFAATAPAAPQELSDTPEG
jgi:hypothetical protein